MTLDQILQDIHALEEDLNMYERKYGVLSETFYDAYMQGEEPPETAWVADWSDWAGVHEIWLDRHQRYQTVIPTPTTRTSHAIIPTTSTCHPTSNTTASLRRVSALTGPICPF